jgi:hypothetical protein
MITTSSAAATTASTVLDRFPKFSCGMPANDASRRLLHGSAGDIGGGLVNASFPGWHQSHPRQDAHVTPPTLVLIIAALTLLSTPALAQPPSAGIFDGDIREAIAEIRQHREALKEQAAESREWRGILERWEPRTWDGSKIGTFIANLFAPFAWVVQIVKLALYALIAVCVARSIRDLSETFRPWFTKGISL